MCISHCHRLPQDDSLEVRHPRFATGSAIGNHWIQIIFFFDPPRPPLPEPPEKCQKSDPAKTDFGAQIVFANTIWGFFFLIQIIFFLIQSGLPSRSALKSVRWANKNGFQCPNNIRQYYLGIKFFLILITFF